MLMTIFFFFNIIGYIPSSPPLSAMLRPKKDSFPSILLKIHCLAGGGREEVASFTYITGKFQHFFTSTVASVEVAFRLNVKHLS